MTKAEYQTWKGLTKEEYTRKIEVERQIVNEAIKRLVKKNKDLDVEELLE